MLCRTWKDTPGDLKQASSIMSVMNRGDRVVLTILTS